MNGVGLDDWLKTSLQNLASKHKPDHRGNDCGDGRSDDRDRPRGSWSRSRPPPPRLTMTRMSGWTRNWPSSPSAPICKALQTADPENAEGYQTKRRRLCKERLEALDAEIAKKLTDRQGAPSSLRFTTHSPTSFDATDSRPPWWSRTRPMSAPPPSSRKTSTNSIRRIQGARSSSPNRNLPPNWPIEFPRISNHSTGRAGPPGDRCAGEEVRLRGSHARERRKRC